MSKFNIPITKPYIGEEEKRFISEAIDSGWISQGPRVAEFEEEFAVYVGSRHAVAMSSCTTALHAALVESAVGQGDEVIVPSLSFIATANAVVYCGAIPVFVDIDPKTCNLDPDCIEGAVTKKTRAIIAVHQMGLPADLDAIGKIAGKHHLKIIEDAACAVGSAYKGKKIGRHGNVACFSFHPRKVITTGEGGMITTDDPDAAGHLRRLRLHGMSVSDAERHAASKVIIETYPEIGYNYKMTDLQASMGIAQLQKLPFIIDKRRQIAEFYNKELSRIPCVRVSRPPEYAFHNYQSYWIELTDPAPVSRDMLMQKLLEKGISTRRGIMAIHLEDCYIKRYGRINLPETERITRNTLLLPIYPQMTSEEQNYVVESFAEVLR